MEALFPCKELSSNFTFKLLWGEAFCRGSRTGKKVRKTTCSSVPLSSHSLQNQFCHVGSRLFSIFCLEGGNKGVGSEKGEGRADKNRRWREGVRWSLCFWNKMSNGMFTFQTATGQCPFPSLICGDQLFGQGCSNPSGRALHFESQSEVWEQTQLKEESTLPPFCKTSLTLPLVRDPGR